MSGEPAPDAPPAASADEALVGAVLDASRGFRHRIWVPVLLGFTMLFDAWDGIAIAFVMPSLTREWGIDPLQMGVLVSSGYGGQFAGALLLGAVAERFGRLPVLIAAVAIMSALALGCAFASGYSVLFALRLVQGVAIGGAIPVAITYINELAPTRSRGRYFGIYQTLALSGSAVAAITSPFIVPNLGWRWMFGLGAVPILLLPLLWATLPESPRWLARTGRLDAANRALLKLGGDAVRFTGAAPSERAPRIKAGVLIAPGLRAHTLSVTALWFLTMFVSYGLSVWIPSIYVNTFHIPLARALTYSAVTSCLMMATLVTIGSLIDRFGRRPLAMGGLLTAAFIFIGIAATGASGETVIVVLTILGQLAILFGAFILWPYTAETYRTDVRALALGYASSVGRASSMLCPIFIGFVFSRGASIGIVFAIFGLFALAAFLIWLTRTRETTAQPLDAV